MVKKAKIQDLLDKDLTDFKIVEMTEVYKTNDDGKRTDSLGFFKDPNIAEAFKGGQNDASWMQTKQALVLTNGTVGYAIENQDPVKLFNDEAEAVEIKKKAIAKLSPAERRLLGYNE